MKKTKLLYVVSFLTLVILVSSTIFTIWLFEDQVLYKDELGRKEQNLMTAGSWNLTDPILIDDSDPSKNWSKTANDNDWCSGSGTWNDPYALKNIWMNISSFDPAIEIRNSNVYFQIENCSLFSRIGIALSNTNNSIINGNNISSWDWEVAIFLSHSNNNSINNNFIWDSSTGIKILNGSRNRITSNLVKDGFEHGIIIEGSDSHDCFIFNNTLINFLAGIYLYGRSHTLSLNSITGNGITLGPEFEEMISYDIDTSNTVNNKPIYYYANETYLNSEDFVNAGQILLANCNNSKIDNLKISGSGLGLLLGYCFNLQIHNLTLTNLTYGIGLFECYNNTFSKSSFLNNMMGIWALWGCENNNFTNNEFINNSHVGIKSACNDDLFLNNLFQDNEYGLYFYLLAERNLVYRNVFINNTFHAYDEETLNFWDNGMIGNYWDDYNGTDLNFDGIGDTPYNISGTTGNQDNFPLVNLPCPKISIMSPSENTTFGTMSPEFEISIQGIGIYTIWYTIDNGIHNYTIIELGGTINLTAWDNALDGFITIQFYIKDSTGSIGTSLVIVVKKSPDTTTPGIPGYNLFTLCGVCGIISLIVLRRRKFNV